MPINKCGVQLEGRIKTIKRKKVRQINRLTSARGIAAPIVNSRTVALAIAYIGKTQTMPDSLATTAFRS